MDERPAKSKNPFNRTLKQQLKKLASLTDDTEVREKLNQIIVSLKKNKAILNQSSFAILFSQLKLLKGKFQEFAEELIFFSIEQLENLPLQKSFYPDQLTQIFNALPSLPVNWGSQQNFISTLISKLQTSLSSSAGKFDSRQLITLLGALAKLGFPGAQPKSLVAKILKILDPFKKNLAEFDSSSLSELWQFCVYANYKFNKKKLTKLLTLTEAALSKVERQPITISKAHLRIAELLKKYLLTPEYIEKLVLEHPVGAYSLDIAFIDLKLNIEIDGEHHYRSGGRLIRSHNFRDFVLAQHGQWTVVRISLEEYIACNTLEEKLEYLKSKLIEKNFGHILMPRAPTSPLMAKQGLHKSPSQDNMPLALHAVEKASSSSTQTNGPKV